MATKPAAKKTPVKKKQLNHGDKDWDGARLFFVTHGGCKKEDVAKKFGIPAGLLRKRSQREGWDAEREEFLGNLSKQVKDDSLELQANALKAWNDETVVEAGFLRKAARKLYMREMADGTWRFNKLISAKSISAAAQANVAADKLARLAFGTSTENNNNTNNNLPTSVADFV